jgi:hypothetical protein
MPPLRRTKPSRCALRRPRKREGLAFSRCTICVLRVNTYTVLRLVHGYWRWVVLATAIVVLVRSLAGLVKRKPWTPVDDRAVRAFGGALDLQIMIGLVLYFGFSPFWPATYQTFGETMRSDVARFFGVEHGIAMLLAATAAYAGRIRAKRARDARQRHLVTLVATLIFFALALWAVPWPWRVAGRPLFRTEF